MALTQAQLNALYGVNDLTPDQSSTALGHSTGVMSSLLNGAKSIAGDVANEAVRGVQSAVRAPGDIVAGLQGKAPDTSTLPNFTGEGQQTFQGEFASKTLPAVEAGKESPLAATAKTVGGVLSSALDFIGLGVGGKAAAKAAPKVIEGAAKGTQAAIDVVRPPVALATKRLAATADMLTKNELAEEASRVTTAGKLLPSATEKRAGELLAGKTYASPVKTLQSVKSEIATKGQEVEQYLGENGRPITNEEDFGMFKTAREKASKYLTPSQLSGYDHAITQFEGELRGMGNMNTGTYYKALKEFEANVTEKLPKGMSALLSDTGTGQLAGAKTVRKVVRDMIGEKHPEFKGKMFDLASLYDAADNVSANVANLAKQSTTFAKRHPVVTGAAKYGAEAIGAGALYEGAKSVGAPLP